MGSSIGNNHLELMYDLLEKKKKEKEIEEHRKIICLGNRRNAADAP